jgi:hypothetical protein
VVWVNCGFGWFIKLDKIVVLETKDELNKRGEIMKRKCEICGDEPVKGFLYPENVNGKWLFHCLKCFKARKKR